MQGIVDRIVRIKALSHDPESAHAEEDDLWRDVLESIASGKCDNPVGYAKEVLKTKKIQFARWCA
jgi:hypothetical protein